ncbi:MAG: carbon-nitrogen family hydrolase [Clostridiales bacterium]|nr:carbon-nitrogen family hydrolase [Clostridiales bacterium]
MKAAVIQFDVRPGEVAANRDKALGYLEEAAAQGAQVALLPELWNCGYDLPNLSSLAENLRGESINLVQKLAVRHKIYVFAGTIAERKDGHYYNTQAVINNKGEIIAKYRKVHLFNPRLGEGKYFHSGDKWALAHTPWGPVGLATCYDLRFPEFSRNLALRGAEMLVFPAQWPGIRLDEWRILCQARAVENQCFVLAANRTGTDMLEGGEFVYEGGSLIVAPNGHILADAGDREGVFPAELDWGLLQAIRQRNNVFADRRPILDEIDDSQV